MIFGRFRSSTAGWNGPCLKLRARRRYLAEPGRWKKGEATAPPLTRHSKNRNREVICSSEGVLVLVAVCLAPARCWPRCPIPSWSPAFPSPSRCPRRSSSHGDVAPALRAPSTLPEPTARAARTSSSCDSAVALVIDQEDGQLLYAKNTDAIMPIASITKLMTAMVVLDAKLPLDEPITISPRGRGHAQGHALAAAGGRDAAAARDAAAGADGLREPRGGCARAHLSGRHGGVRAGDELEGEASWACATPASSIRPGSTRTTSRPRSTSPCWSMPATTIP